MSPESTPALAFRKLAKGKYTLECPFFARIVLTSNPSDPLGFIISSAVLVVVASGVKNNFDGYFSLKVGQGFRYPSPSVLNQITPLVLLFELEGTVCETTLNAESNGIPSRPFAKTPIFSAEICCQNEERPPMSSPATKQHYKPAKAHHAISHSSTRLFLENLLAFEVRQQAYA